MIDVSVTDPQSLDGNPFGWNAAVETFGGNCPVQAEGTVGTPLGRYVWYFRARGDGWRLDVGERLDEHGLVPDGEELITAHGTYGPWPDAGYMEDADAARYITDALVAFSGGARGDWEHPDPRGVRSSAAEVMALVNSAVPHPVTPDDP